MDHAFPRFTTAVRRRSTKANYVDRTEKDPAAAAESDRLGPGPLSAPPLLEAPLLATLAPLLRRPHWPAEAPLLAITPGEHPSRLRVPPNGAPQRYRPSGSAEIGRTPYPSPGRSSASTGLSAGANRLKPPGHCFRRAAARDGAEGRPPGRPEVEERAETVRQLRRGATGGGHQADANHGGRSDDGRTATAMATACAKRRRARQGRSGQQLTTH